MKIGDIKIETNVLPAPIAGISDRPFREIAREFGCELAYTGLVSIEGLRRLGWKTRSLVDIEGEEALVGVQLFGNNPESCAEAVKVLSGMNVSLIDINMGCPARKIINNCGGVALMKNPSLAAEIVSAAKEYSSVPITVKIRSGWDADSINAVEFAQILQTAGAEAITVHPRTRAQQFGGHSDWSVIRAVKQAVDIPVIGNGDIAKPSDALRMLEQTGCDAVMIGRAAIGNPWIFRNTIAAISGAPCAELDDFIPSLEQRVATVLNHARRMIIHKGERRGMIEMRKHAIRYTRGLRNAKALRREFGQITSIESLEAALRLCAPE